MKPRQPEKQSPGSWFFQNNHQFLALSQVPIALVIRASEVTDAVSRGDLEVVRISGCKAVALEERYRYIDERGGKEMKTPAAETKRLSSPHQLRAIRLLQQGPRTVKDLAHQIGCNGAPQLIATLREKGLTILVEWQDGRDRDSRKVKHGKFHLSPESANLADHLIEEFVSREEL